MVLSDYYKILDIPVNSSVEEIKKAYRKKARLYHPDINHAPDAKDKFIKATEAYDFLISNHDKSLTVEEEYIKVMEEWTKLMRERSQQRARYYARKSYASFRTSKYYRSTRILNESSVIFIFAISIMVFIYTILGFIIRIRNPEPDEKGPPIFSFILLLTLSLILFSVSFFYLKAFIEENRKHGKKK